MPARTRLLSRRATWAALAAWLLAGCGPKPHVYVAEQMAGNWRIAILPLANYTTNRDAPDRVLPVLAVELATKPGVQVVDPGEVETALAKEPWLILDRIPLDLVEALGRELSASAILVGSLTGYSTRQLDGELIPQVALSLRLLQVPGGRVMWNAVHSRDGADGEWIFGFGRVQSLEQLALITIREMLKTFPIGNEAWHGAEANVAGKTE